MELRGLVQYLVNQLKRGEGIELILLQVLHCEKCMKMTYDFESVIVKIPCALTWLIG